MTSDTEKGLLAGGIVVGLGLLVFFVSRNSSAGSLPGSSPGQLVGPFSVAAANGSAACLSNGPIGGFTSGDPPPEVQSFLNPNGIDAGSWTGGPVFCLYNGILYQFSNPAGYSSCANVDASKLGS